ncbi:hypothetical protein E4V42_23185 [Clostridium estertheticum]|uniref:Uncharacterized protein n=1 Tax=Clostridium estertheticum TaxID=238834 RepID=A0A5N7IVI3_9CLOT|nr:hypothetical protein [Clostridium estertheticum]MPQ34292.1 hypothetical protein [Clostridium estertheticum]MPQ64954.1 hypothetical protein [Clostridium estertheticum]
MTVEKPRLVTYIVALNFLNVFLLTVSFFPKPNFFEKFGVYFNTVPSFSEGMIRMLMIISLVIISYGFLNLKGWGYWLMIAYNSFFLAESLFFLLKQNGQSHNTSGFITSLLGLMITFPSKRYFFKESKSS